MNKKKDNKQENRMQQKTLIDTKIIHEFLIGVFVKFKH